MDIRSYNREAWDRQVRSGKNPWTIPVSAELIARARADDWSVVLTESRPVPREWFPPLKGIRMLGLACGGGQQGPIFAAAGADVTILDNSPAQLGRDREVAQREGLTIHLVEGDAADLSMFEDETFDIVFNPCSTVFMKDVRAVWKETHRVLRQDGILMTGSMNPVFYIFDSQKMWSEIYEVKNSIPYSDVDSLSKEEMEKGFPLEFGHSLTDLLGGQCAAGFQIVDMYEDIMPDLPLSKYHPIYFATKAIKL